jgi:pimeloyl-[acyl-carrier protein] methyl ester esterase
MSALHVETYGAGPPLVLLHGWGLNVRVWDELIPLLSPRFSVITVDLPGHGRSEWDDRARTLSGMAQCVQDAIRSQAQQRAAPPLNVLGWSLGGQVALEWTACATDSIDRLVLVATTPKFAASADWPQGMPVEILEGFARQLATDYRQTVTDFLELQVRGSANGDAVLRKLRAALFAHGEASPAALTAGLGVLESADLRPQLPSIQQSTLVVAGQYDRVTSPRAGHALTESLPHAKYVEIRRAGHAPFLSHAETFMDALNSFFSLHAA